MTKISNLSSPDSFFQAQNAPKSVFGRGGRLGPRWGSLRRSPRPLVGWDGGAGEGDTPSPFPFPLDAFGVSNSAPNCASFLSTPQHKILAAPVSKSLSLTEP